MEGVMKLRVSARCSYPACSGYLRLQNKPAAQVDATNLLAAPTEIDTPAEYVAERISDRQEDVGRRNSLCRRCVGTEADISQYGYQRK